MTSSPSKNPARTRRQRRIDNTVVGVALVAALAIVIWLPISPIARIALAVVIVLAVALYDRSVKRARVQARSRS
jgi:hypothetical protein